MKNTQIMRRESFPNIWLSVRETFLKLDLCEPSLLIRILLSSIRS